MDWTGPWFFLLKKKLFVDLRERELYVFWAGIKPTTLAYQNNALPNWTTRPESWIFLMKLFGCSPLVPVFYFSPILCLGITENKNFFSEPIIADPSQTTQCKFRISHHNSLCLNGFGDWRCFSHTESLLELVSGHSSGMSGLWAKEIGQTVMACLHSSKNEALNLSSRGLPYWQS